MELIEYGHWVPDEPFDPNEWLGFVYIMTMANGQRYVGAKKIWSKIKKPPCEFARGPKAGFKESDWRQYRSSSKVITENNMEVVDFRIVSVHKTWGKTLFTEAIIQFALETLPSTKFLNYQIEGQWTAGSWEPKAFALAERLKAEHLPENELTAVENGIPLRSLTDPLRKITVDENSCTNSLHIDWERVRGLASGEYFRVGDWSLPKEYERKKSIITFDDGSTFEGNVTDANKHLGKRKGWCELRIKKGVYQYQEMETLSEWRARLLHNFLV